MPIDSTELQRHFSPDVFLVKLTPVNPTHRARRNEIVSHIKPDEERYAVVDSLRAAGYETIVSIGELEENRIGSNCGQYVSALTECDARPDDSYSYPARLT